MMMNDEFFSHITSMTFNHVLSTSVKQFVVQKQTKIMSDAIREPNIRTPWRGRQCLIAGSNLSNHHWEFLDRQAMEMMTNKVITLQRFTDQGSQWQLLAPIGLSSIFIK